MPHGGYHGYISGLGQSSSTGSTGGPAGMGSPPPKPKPKPKPTTGSTGGPAGMGSPPPKPKPKPITGTTSGPAGMGSPPPKPKPKPKPKPDEDKKTFFNKYKKATTLGLGSGTLLGASLGTRKYQQIQDIRKINRWADRTSRMFGKTYPQLKRKINPALMARTSGQFIPSNIYAKTGHPAGISNWWNKRSSPTHFAGAEKVVNPILKTSAKFASKLLGPASWLISTPANANEDERMAIIRAQWNQEKNKENKVWDGEKLVDIKPDIGGLMKDISSITKDKVSEIMDERGLLSKDGKIDKAIDTLKKGKDVILNTKDKLIEKDSISDKIIKESIERALKGDPILEHEFDVPFGGKGKVSIDNSLQQGGIMLIWDLGGNYKLKEWKQKKGE